MLKPTNLYEEATRRLNELREYHRIVQKRYVNAPPGKLRILKSGRRIQYYLRREPADRSGIYLRKSENRKQIQIYLQKIYDEKLISLLEKEMDSLESLLLHSKEIPNQIQKLHTV